MLRHQCAVTAVCPLSTHMDMCRLWTSVANPLESPINCVVGAAWCWCCPTQVSHSLGLCKLTSTHSHHDVTAPCAPKQTLASVGMTRLTPTTIQTAKEDLSTSHPTLLHMTARKSHHPTATGVNASALASSHATQTLRPIRCYSLHAGNSHPSSSVAASMVSHSVDTLSVVWLQKCP